MSIILHYPELEIKEIEITIIATYSAISSKYKVRSKEPLKEG